MSGRGTFWANPPKHQKKRMGRWKRADAIDRLLAGRFIRYFMDRFITNPENKHEGEMTLILMTLIWASRQSDPSNILLKEVVNLQCSQVNPEMWELNFGDKDIDISEGLCSLLAILMGDRATQTTSQLFRALIGLKMRLKRLQERF